MADINRPVDRLSRMPPEIIQYIFDLAYIASCESEDMWEPWEYEQISAGPPSRFFRPFFNRSFYYGVGLDGRDMVKRFCDRVPASSLAFVHSLAISGDDSRGPTQSEDTSVARMLSQTPHLESLTIYQYDALASLVLSPLVATFAFRHLRRLKLTCMCPDGVDPFDPQLYTALPLYPSLRQFELDIAGIPDSAAVVTSLAPPSPHSPFASLEHIDLCGPLSCSLSAAALISSASRVSTLHLEEVDEGQVSSYELLSALPHPERLKDLDFYINVDTHIGDPAFFRDLAKLRLLRTLEFSKLATVKLSDLSAFVDVVELDTLSVGIGERATNSLVRPEVFGIRSRAQALERPVQLAGARWPPDFAKEDFRIFAAKCESKGIQLSGNALGLLKMEDEFHSGATERWRLAHLERAGKGRAGEEAEAKLNRTREIDMNDTNRPVDHLSRMPPEIIQFIFDLAYEGYVDDTFGVRLEGRISVGPPSRFLRPFFDRSFYHRVGVRGRDRVKTFCDRVPASSLASVHLLTISGLNFEGSSQPEDTSVARMLSQTPRLESLTICQWDCIASLVLSPLVATFAFRHLRSLKLVCECPDGIDPFDPRLYTALPLYPSLRQFELEFVGDPALATVDSGALPPSHAPFVSLDHILLSGHLSRSLSASALISSASRVSTLRLEETEVGQIASYQLLSALPHPERLKEMEYISECNISAPSPLPNVSISRFENLASFYLGVQTHIGNPAFFGDLAKLRLLRTLEFDDRATMSLSDLSAFVDVAKLDTLSVGISAPATNSLRKFRALNSSSRDWDPIQLREADWRPDFSRDEFRQFAAKCEAKGIKLVGDAIDSLILEDEFRSGETQRQWLASRDWMKEACLDEKAQRGQSAGTKPDPDE
ncbi:hypothetical protein JCM3766R1_006830 [Sporobolomyces carnicolor]